MADKNEKLRKDLEKILNPIIIKRNLIRSSLYLTAFELLKNTIEQNIKNFLCVGEEVEEDFKYLNSQEYKDEIVNRKIPELNNNKNIYYSSCLWLYETNAITRDDVEELQKIRLHRNKIAHDIPALMIDSDHEIDLYLFESIRILLTKIEQWWIVEIEIPTNPYYNYLDNVEMKDIKSGSMVLLDHLIEIVKEEMKI